MLLGKLYTRFLVVLHLGVFKFPSCLVPLALFPFCSRLYDLSDLKNKMEWLFEEDMGYSAVEYPRRLISS